MFRITLCFVVFLFGASALQADTCLARKRIGDVGLQYARLFIGSYSSKRDAAQELSRLMPRKDHLSFALQLNAEGYGIDASRLVRAFSQIDGQVQKLNAGHPIEALGPSVRAVLPALSGVAKCPSPLNDMPTKVSMKRSIGSDGGKNAAPFKHAPHSQNSTGTLQSFALPNSLSRLSSIIALVVILIISARYLFKRRWIAFFGRKSRLARRSVSLDFEITQNHGDELNIMTVSSVDISTGGMKIALKDATEEPLAVGSQIEMHLPGRDVWGSVVWSNKFFCGVAFQRRLSNRAFRKIIGET